MVADLEAVDDPIAREALRFCDDLVREDRRRTQEAGFDHHIVKPLDPLVLESLLNYVETAHRFLDEVAEVRLKPAATRSYLFVVNPERDTRNGIPICAHLITISEVRRPVV